MPPAGGRLQESEYSTTRWLKVTRTHDRHVLKYPQARNPLVDRLPIPYAVALRLRRAGHPDAAISDALDIEPSSVRSVISLAEAKLSALERDDPPPVEE
jgi:hypothetical protein